MPTLRIRNFVEYQYTDPDSGEVVPRERRKDWPWRKVARVEEGPFKLLDWEAKALARSLIVHCDVDGVLDNSGRLPHDAVRILVGGDPRSWKRFKRLVRDLLNAKYLEWDGPADWDRAKPVARVDRLPVAQPIVTGSSTDHEPTMNRPSTDHERIMSGSSTDHENAKASGIIGPENDKVSKKESKKDPLTPKPAEPIETTASVATLEAFWAQLHRKRYPDLRRFPGSQGGPHWDRLDRSKAFEWLAAEAQRGGRWKAAVEMAFQLSDEQHGQIANMPARASPTLTPRHFLNHVNAIVVQGPKLLGAKRGVGSLFGPTAPTRD